MKKAIGVLIGVLVFITGIFLAVKLVSALVGESITSNNNTVMITESAEVIESEPVAVVEESTSSSRQTGNLIEFGISRTVISKDEAMVLFSECVDSTVDFDRLKSNVNKVSLNISTSQSRYLTTLNIEDISSNSLVGFVDKEYKTMTLVAEAIDDLPRYVILEVKSDGTGNDYSKKYIELLSDRINTRTPTMGGFEDVAKTTIASLNDFPKVERPTKPTEPVTTAATTTEQSTEYETSPVMTLSPELPTAPPVPETTVQTTEAEVLPTETPYYGPGSGKDVIGDDTPDLIFLQAVTSTSTQYNSWASNFAESEIKQARTKADIDMQAVYDHAKIGNEYVLPETLFKAVYDQDKKILIIEITNSDNNIVLGTLDNDCRYSSSISNYKERYDIE